MKAHICVNIHAHTHYEIYAGIIEMVVSDWYVYVLCASRESCDPRPQSHWQKPVEDEMELAGCGPHVGVLQRLLRPDSPTMTREQ